MQRRSVEAAPRGRGRTAGRKIERAQCGPHGASVGNRRRGVRGGQVAVRRLQARGRRCDLGAEPGQEAALGEFGGNRRDDLEHLQ